MRQSNFSLCENFKSGIINKWMERTQLDKSKFSNKKFSDDLKKFITERLEEYNYNLYNYYKDKQGLGKDMINRHLKSLEGYPHSQEIINLFCYYAFERNYPNCVRDNILPDNLFQYNTLEVNISSLLIEASTEIEDSRFSAEDSFMEILEKKDNAIVQKDLNEKINKIEHDDITQYHLDRVNCMVYTTAKNLLREEIDEKDKRRFYLNNINDWKEIFSHIANRKSLPLAGGWYLNNEQKQFLKDELIAIFGDFSGDLISICEAGCASYIHHFTYVSIVIDALIEANKIRKENNRKKTLRASITVIDEFEFPLYQIAEVDRKLIKPKKLYPMQFDGVKDIMHGFYVKADFIDFLNQYFGLKHYDSLIETHYQHYNLCVRDPKKELTFDVITEHFLIRIDKDEYDLKKWLENICATYKSFAKQTLHIISAIGNNAKSENGYYFDLYEKNDFYKIKMDSVWDIYDQNKFYGNQVNKGTEVTLDNYLVHWKYVKPNN